MRREQRTAGAVRRRAMTAVLLGVGLLSAACSGGDDEVESADSVAASTTIAATTTVPATTVPEAPPPTLPPPVTPPVVSTTLPPDVARMPLTGVPVGDASEIPDRPALAVKIANDESARPQAGLNRADVVFEEIINDGYTRLAAVFHSQEVDVVGPVRSGRYPDIPILEAFDRPLFAWSGGNGGVTYYITRSQLVDLSALHSDGYYRRSGRSAPNNLYTSSEAMWAQSPDDASIPPGVFQYLRETDSLEGEPATTVEIVMDNQTVRWEYDAESGRYLRWHNGDEHNTEDDGQVSTDNLVVMKVDYVPSPIDADTPDAQMLGSHEVFIFADGMVRTGLWLRWVPTDRYAFFDNLDDLNELRLQPGRTFVELARNIDGVLTYSA